MNTTMKFNLLRNSMRLFCIGYAKILYITYFTKWSMTTLLPSFKMGLIDLTALPGLFMIDSKCQSWTCKFAWLSTHIKGAQSHLSQFSIPREKNHIHLSVIYSNVRRYFLRLNIRTNHTLSSHSFYTSLKKDHTWGMANCSS